MPSLEKPGAGTSAIIYNLIATSTISGTPDFYIKVLEADFDYFSPDVEVTGDGDNEPNFENNGFLYSDWRLRGAMVADKAIGLANIVDSTNNPTPAVISFKLGGQRALQQKLLIRRIRLAWKRAGYFVGVSIVARLSGTSVGTSTPEFDWNT